MTTTATKLISFHGNPEIKTKYLARVIAHRKADEIIKGTDWQDGKGCAVGCTIHSKENEAYETELGLPEWLAHLEDQIFESLPNGDALSWPERFLEAIPVGVDLQPVKFRFLAWLLVDKKDGVVNLVKDANIKSSIEIIGRLLGIEADRPLSKDEVAEGDKAARVAWGTTAWAAWDAWDAGADGAAMAVGDAWTAWDARDAYIKRFSEKLLELLAETQREEGKP